MRSKISLALLLVIASCGVDAAQASRSAKADYERLLSRERAITARPSVPPAPRLVRRVIAEYENFSRQYRRTGYADNALWQAGQLAAGLFERTRLARDGQTATRLLRQLVSGYPSSSLVPVARARLRDVDRGRAQPKTAASPMQSASRTAVRTRPPSTVPPSPATLTPEPQIAARSLPDLEPKAGSASRNQPQRSAASATASASLSSVRILDVRRAVLPELVRVTIELDGEVPFRAEQIESPARVFFDLQGARPAPPIRDLLLDFDDEAVRGIRLGQRTRNSTRIVIQTAGPQRHSVFTLYNPFRIVVDFDRGAVAAVPTTGVSWTPPASSTLPPATDGSVVPAPKVQAGSSARSRASATVPDPEAPAEDASAVSRTSAIEPTDRAPLVLPAPEAPRTNSTGSFSISRQLGLGVSRVVIDPGHGGHDPGALGKRVSEAELVLDVALRLEKLLGGQPGVDVVLTRRTDQFVPLEERTAIANRERADLFLSIHANASRNTKAGGIETYFLNFANNPEAAAVAARENSASGRTMHALPDIVKAIALNNKMDESRDFAALVQRAIIRRLHDHDVKDLGVKQAPFVVLIGAQMPSVLAEISFVTNQREAQLLRTPAYRQKIAEALFDSVVGYQRSLKSLGTVASQE